MGTMDGRPLYIAAYDIARNRSRARACQLLKSFSTGGQKSVYECFLSPAAKKLLISGISPLIEPEDRFLLVRLDPRSRVLTLGRAVAPEDPPFFYVG